MAETVEDVELLKTYQPQLEVRRYWQIVCKRDSNRYDKTENKQITEKNILWAQDVQLKRKPNSEGKLKLLICLIKKADSFVLPT